MAEHNAVAKRKLDLDDTYDTTHNEPQSPKRTKLTEDTAAITTGADPTSQDPIDHARVASILGIDDETGQVIIGHIIGIIKTQQRTIELFKNRIQELEQSQTAVDMESSSPMKQVMDLAAITPAAATTSHATTVDEATVAAMVEEQLAARRTELESDYEARVRIAEEDYTKRTNRMKEHSIHKIYAVTKNVREEARRERDQDAEQLMKEHDAEIEALKAEHDAASKIQFRITDTTGVNGVVEVNEVTKQIIDNLVASNENLEALAEAQGELITVLKKRMELEEQDAKTAVAENKSLRGRITTYKRELTLLGWKPPFRFLELPGELRNRIYEFLLPANKVVVVHNESKTSHRGEQFTTFDYACREPSSYSTHDYPHIGVFRLNRQVRREALAILLKQNTIEIPPRSDLFDFIGEAQLKNVGKLIITSGIPDRYERPEILSEFMRTQLSTLARDLERQGADHTRRTAVLSQGDQLLW